MKKTILTKIEYELLVESLEQLQKHTDDSLADSKWFDKLNTTRRQYELELDYYKIKKYGEPSTKSHMLQWLITKIKNKTLDL